MATKKQGILRYLPQEYRSGVSKEVAEKEFDYHYEARLGNPDCKCLNPGFCVHAVCIKHSKNKKKVVFDVSSCKHDNS